MGLKTEVKLSFNNDFKGVLNAKNGELEIGLNEGQFAPYDLLLGSLGSCLYATFLEVAKKKRIDFESTEMKIFGEKREEVPTVLKKVQIEFIVHNAQKEKGLIQAFDLAAKYCSIFTTISSVSKIDYKINFLYS